VGKHLGGVRHSAVDLDADQSGGCPDDLCPAGSCAVESLFEQPGRALVA
jgi:hypothetical protein